MKYKQLTKEQFEALHEEFAQFLATQQVDIKEWNAIKKDNPEVADQELNLFSDVVWDDVLNKTRFLEHFSEQNINLFKCDTSEVSRIVVQIDKPDFSFFNDKDYNWFIDNTQDKAISFLKGTKKYDNDRNAELFDLIQKGSVIADGKLYNGIYELIK